MYLFGPLTRFQYSSKCPMLGLITALYMGKAMVGRILNRRGGGGYWGR